MGEIGNVEGFIGGVAAEEPRAALIGRDVLAAGGTAADAAVAAFFTLAVTYPAGAGLGGGGLCLYYDATTDTVETLEFLPSVPAGGGPYAVPGSLRGMAALHARYGRLRWSRVVAPAEEIARFGRPVSRALAHRLEAERGRLAAHPDVARLLLEPDGAPLAEGRLLQQVALAATLSGIRGRGVGEFYGGELGRRFIVGATAAGGGMTLADLRHYRPVWRGSEELEANNLTVHTAARPEAVGTPTRALLRPALRGEAGLPGAPAGGMAGRQQAGPGRGDGEAALVAGDRRGSIAACTFTMGRDFGAARIAPAAGILLAPVEAATDPVSSPVLAINHNVDQAFLAAAAAGGAAAPAALAQVASGLLIGDLALEPAMEAPRAARLRPGGPLVPETAAGGRRQAMAGDAALPVRLSVELGRVQALWCSDGLERAPGSCSFRADRRGFGLAVGGAF